MTHAVLLGDSIFDNAAYVGPGEAVIDAFRPRLPVGWCATLLAVDGSTTTDVAAQLARLPGDATHLVISCGGNDALGQLGALQAACTSVHQALAGLAPLVGAFRQDYRAMLAVAQHGNLPVAVCTVYDAIPGLDAATRLALNMYNDVILREAVLHGVPVLDLRAVLPDAADYAAASPIEPSARGACRIAVALRLLVDMPVQYWQTCRVHTGIGTPRAPD